MGCTVRNRLRDLHSLRPVRNQSANSRFAHARGCQAWQLSRCEGAARAHDPAVKTCATHRLRTARAQGAKESRGAADAQGHPRLRPV
jgi:hypothetical protein